MLAIGLREGFIWSVETEKTPVEGAQEIGADLYAVHGIRPEEILLVDNGASIAPKNTKDDACKGCKGCKGHANCGGLGQCVGCDGYQSPVRAAGSPRIIARYVYCEQWRGVNKWALCEAR